MMRRKTAFFARAWRMLVLCAAPTLAQAASAPSDLAVSDPWIRVVGGNTPAAAYFTLSNASDRPEVLVGASSPACGKLTMHQSRNENGVESMVMVAERPVPSHGKIVFAPGGYHLMCMSPSKAVRTGARVPIVLSFADGQRLRVRFPVRPLGAGAP
jgi:copper(I)-binding protein